MPSIIFNLYFGDVSCISGYGACYVWSRGGSRAGSLGGAQQLTGGGGSSRNFLCLQKPARFSGEGGGSSRNVLWSPEAGAISVGGGSSSLLEAILVDGSMAEVHG